MLFYKMNIDFLKCGISHRYGTVYTNFDRRRTHSRSQSIAFARSCNPSPGSDSPFVGGGKDAKKDFRAGGDAHRERALCAAESEPRPAGAGLVSSPGAARPQAAPGARAYDRTAGIAAPFSRRLWSVDAALDVAGFGGDRPPRRRGVQHQHPATVAGIDHPWSQLEAGETAHDQSRPGV